LDAARNDRERCALLFCTDTGVRPSELLALRTSDIDFERNRIKIARSQTPYAVVELPSLDDDKPIAKNRGTKTPKNGRIRAVPLSPALKDALRKHDMEDELVFPELLGRGHLRQRVKATMVAAGLDRFANGKARPFRTYDLRHTFASHLAMRGVPLARISRWLGHTSVTTTEIYAHLGPCNDDPSWEGSADEVAMMASALYPTSAATASDEGGASAVEGVASKSTGSR